MNAFLERKIRYAAATYRKNAPSTAGNEETRKFFLKNRWAKEKCGKGKKDDVHPLLYSLFAEGLFWGDSYFSLDFALDSDCFNDSDSFV